jgi:hypothetical protein
MSTTVTTRQLNNLFRRQEKMEKELSLLKETILTDEDHYIRPEVLKRWERISRDMDKQKGCSFASISAMRKWLTAL